MAQIRRNTQCRRCRDRPDQEHNRIRSVRGADTGIGWYGPYFRPVLGQEVEAIILDINPEKERVTLGIKQLTESADSNAVSIKKGAVVSGTVSEVTPDELIVALPGDARGVIRRTDLSREKNEQDTSKFKVGDTVEASVVSVEDNTVKLSIRALQVTLEKQAVKEYANQADSGSVLGDILGAAIENSKK